MKVYYATFGQASALRNGWIEITASDEDKARREASRYPNWCGFYTREALEEKYFPAGCVGRITV